MVIAQRGVGEGGNCLQTDRDAPQHPEIHLAVKPLKFQDNKNDFSAQKNRKQIIIVRSFIWSLV